MGKIIHEVDRGTRLVADVDVRVTELVWDDGARSFEVHRVDTGDDLTEDECFDTTPTDEQIAIRLDRHKRIEWWTCRGCGTRVDATQADPVVDHVKVCDPVDGAGNPIGGAS
jgi:hypothetical protein